MRLLQCLIFTDNSGFEPIFLAIVNSIARIDTINGGGSNSVTAGILGLTQIHIPLVGNAFSLF
ncbi:hypothetical protein H6G93_25140 [Nostoc sp. FACHB-973]|nr:hypothetical protein [Nostoc sp. FACHB-973]